MCHTATGLSNGKCLIVGGRTSPAKGFDDCWLREGKQWRQTQSLPTSRFRHNAVKVILDSECVLVYGGKASDGTVLGDWLIWNSNGDGWAKVETSEASPKPRFGASMINVDNTSGLVFGGIGQDGTILEDFWTWKLNQRSDGSLVLDFTDQARYLREASPLVKFVHRFGATVNVTSWGVVIVGGIIPDQIIPLDKEIMLLDSTEMLKSLNGRSSWSSTILSTIGLGGGFRGPRPLLTGHVSYAINPHQVLILGGGAVCFSFGTHWTEGTWVLKRADSAIENEWTLVSESMQAKQLITQPESSTPLRGVSEAVQEIVSIPRVRIEHAAQFQQILADGKPVIIEGSDIGPCTDLWTKEYLANAVGRDREVVVHEAKSANMSFQAKNFAYTAKSFGTFLDEVYAGGRLYLRSISAEQPTKLPASLAADFPNLNDFHLPESLAIVTENAHSSPLRISGPVTLWLHYDVMANVLCQIRGEKRLILFPPQDVQHLSVPAGASSSTINIFQSCDDGSITSIPQTSPQEALLTQGDILFIPPLWLHTASPTGQVSVAVNVFFRNLSKGYAAGRDVYGNRDLQAYEKARADLQKIERSFDELPTDMARFYLSRLAQELKEMAEK
ncbi:hypothetical protein EYZ11_002638 [Aspergillus tanneri]|nr:hypothetical protein EYZ11_002638 [Aspergillus tanneri]